jgi:hypothetical protein
MTTQPSTTRRTVLRTLGVLGVAGAATGIGVTTMSRGAAAAVSNLSIDGDTVRTDTGAITDVRLSVRGNWQYDGVDGDYEGDYGHSIAGVLVRAEAGRVDSPGHPYVIGSQWIPTGSDVHAASGDFAIEDKTIFTGGHYGPVLDDFLAEEDGSSKSTPVLVHLHVAVKYNGPSGPTAVETVRETRFVVTVTNQRAEADFQASGEADAQGDDAYPLGAGSTDELGLTWSTGHGMWRVDNRNPDGTAPIPFTLVEAGDATNYVEADALADHYGYPTADGPNGRDAHGQYYDLGPVQTVKLLVGGSQVAVKARGQVDASGNDPQVPDWLQE